MHNKLRDTPPVTEERINLVAVCRQIMRIVARLEGNAYTEAIERRTEVVEHLDPANPASDFSTTQG